MAQVPKKHHRCEVPCCVRWAPPWLFCCHQHNAILPFELRVQFQTAWTYRDVKPVEFEVLKTAALARWGWSPHPIDSRNTPCQTP